MDMFESAFLGYMVEQECGFGDDVLADATAIVSEVNAGASWEEILSRWGDEYNHEDLYKIYEYFGHTSEI